MTLTGIYFLDEQSVAISIVSTRGGIGEVTSADTLTGTAEGDKFFIVEPGLNVGVNVAPWFRILMGASYRWVDGVQGVTGVNNDDLSGLSGTIMLKFGWF
jgi:hypothetical protein